MTFLLNPRVLITLALVALLTFTHLSAYRKGKHDIRMEWQASIAQANIESFKASERRQRNVDAAEVAAATRETRLRADAANARRMVDGLRDDLAALRAKHDTGTPEDQRASAFSELLGECARAYSELAAKADRHVNDIRMVLEAWPK